MTETRAGNTVLAKAVVQYSTSAFVVNQPLVLRIIICSENRHFRQARIDRVNNKQINKKQP